MGYINIEDLTTRQYLFCEFYLKNNFNGEEAALRAGHSPRSAKVIACENLTKPKIRAYLDKRMKEMFEELKAGPDYRIEALKFCVEAGKNGKSTKEGIVDIDGIVKSVGEMNKMDGSYAAEKKEISSTAELEITSKTDELRKKYESEH